jgi:hypothetical protein
VKPLSDYMPPVIPREIPLAPASSAALPASIREDGHGGARITIGGISHPYANAAMARAELQAMERRGLVRIEPAPCPARELQPLDHPAPC